MCVKCHILIQVCKLIFSIYKNEGLPSIKTALISIIEYTDVLNRGLAPS